MKRIVLSVFLVLTLSPLIAQEAMIVDKTDVTSGVAEVTVTSDGFAFIPEEIRVRQGVPVRIIFESGGGTHDWTIDRFNATTGNVRGGQARSVEFTPEEAGELEYYCSLPGHRSAGMFGRFIVVADE